MTRPSLAYDVFSPMALALMEWADPPERDEPAPEPSSSRGKETLYGTTEYADPFNIEDDWTERA